MLGGTAKDVQARALLGLAEGQGSKGAACKKGAGLACLHCAEIFALLICMQYGIVSYGPTQTGRTASTFTGMRVLGGQHRVSSYHSSPLMLA